MIIPPETMATSDLDPYPKREEERCASEECP
jgi:hypothetical protein